MKKVISFSIILTFLLSVPFTTLAHPGRTDSSGGHTCRKNCAQYGLQDGQYHNHKGNSTQQTQPTKNKQKSISNKVTVKVNKVIDGDTIQISLNGKIEKVRLIGIDTPETKHPRKDVQYYGPEASKYTKKRLQGQTVTLEFDVQQRDKYGRLLAYVWIGKEHFNATLVKEGYAQILTIPPNVKYADTYKKLQKHARVNKKGLWKR